MARGRQRRAGVSFGIAFVRLRPVSARCGDPIPADRRPPRPAQPLRRARRGREARSSRKEANANGAAPSMTSHISGIQGACVGCGRARRGPPSSDGAGMVGQEDCKVQLRPDIGVFFGCHWLCQCLEAARHWQSQWHPDRTPNGDGGFAILLDGGPRLGSTAPYICDRIAVREGPSPSYSTIIPVHDHPVPRERAEVRIAARLRRGAEEMVNCSPGPTMSV